MIRGVQGIIHEDVQLCESGAIVPTHLTGSERLGAEQYLLHYRITHLSLTKANSPRLAH